MNKSYKTASILLKITSTIILLMSLLLFFGVVIRGNLLLPMENIIGLSTQELNNINPSIVKFILIVYAALSSALFTISIVLFKLIKHTFSTENLWGIKTIFTMQFTFLIPTNIIAFSQFPKGSWQIWIICFALTLISYLITLKESTNKKCTLPSRVDG